MGLIYMRVSPSGGKYIGQTVREEKIRWKEHCKDANNPNNERYNSILSKAIRKYGAENFTVYILEDNITKEELNKKEMYYIKLHNTFYLNNPEQGYNMTLGGDSTYKYEDEYILKLWQTGKTIKEIKNQNHMNYNNLSDRLKNLGITKEEINQRAYLNNNPKRKKVIQYDLYKNYIRTFDSIAEAAKTIGSNTTNISAVCQGKRKTCKGYIFKYEGE